MKPLRWGRPVEMAETNVKREAQRRVDERAEKRRRVMDMLEPRIMTLLIFAPPTLGVILGGVAVAAYQRLTGLELHRIPGDYVTLGLGLFCLAGLGILVFLSIKVWRGRETRFPRLLRLAPFTALAGLAFGLTIAGLKAAGKIH